MSNTAGIRIRNLGDEFGFGSRIDGVTWDGKDPKKYAASFKIHA